MLVDLALNQRYFECKMFQKTGVTFTEMSNYSCKDIICIKCFKNVGGISYRVHKLIIQICYMKYKNFAKNSGRGGGHFVKNSQFIIYKDINLGNKLNGPNLFSWIKFYFTCYTLYTQYEAHF